MLHVGHVGHRALISETLKDRAHISSHVIHRVCVWTISMFYDSGSKNFQSKAKLPHRVGHSRNAYYTLTIDTIK